MAVLQIKVTLRGTKPPIWRRLLVPEEFTLAQLHDVIQAAMGWQNCHLHEFCIGGQRFGIPDPDDRIMGDSECVNERKVRLSDVFGEGGKAEYTYDFGDSWEHALIVEKLLLPDAGLTYPRCTAGKLHGPPEDCGGPPGYYGVLEAIRDLGRESHAEMLEWIGGIFDPKAFSVDAVNRELQRKFQRARKPVAKRAASKPKASLRGATNADLVVRSLVARSETPVRQRIQSDETIDLQLNDDERQLILNHTFADEELTNRLRVVRHPGESPIYRYNLADLDDLCGYVAAEANHATNKKLQKKLDTLFNRISAVLESYTDQED